MCVSVLKLYSRLFLGTQTICECMPVCYSVQVPTVAALQGMDLFRTWLLDEQPITVVGPEGCGKSLLIRHALVGITSYYQLMAKHLTLDGSCALKCLFVSSVSVSTPRFAEKRIVATSVEIACSVPP